MGEEDETCDGCGGEIENWCKFDDCDTGSCDKHFDDFMVEACFWCQETFCMACGDVERQALSDGTFGDVWVCKDC